MLKSAQTGWRRFVTVSVHITPGSGGVWPATAGEDETPSLWSNPLYPKREHVRVTTTEAYQDSSN